MLVKDQLNRTLIFENTPKRIVSLVPSQTELLVDLGLRSKIVGITKFCVHPKNLREECTILGGTKKVNLEKIEALHPDIIICNKEENTKEIVEACAKIAPVWVSDIFSIEDCLDMILCLGEIFQVCKKTSELCEKLVFQIQSFSEEINEKPFKKVAYLIWKNPYMAAGKNTFVDSLLTLNKFENVIKDASSRYPEIGISNLEKADLVLLSSEPYPFKKSDVQELKSTLQTEVRLVDGEYFSWYGSRLLKAIDYFKTLHE